MSYSTSTLLHIPFDGSLLEKVSGSLLTYTGTPSFVNGKFSQAWQMSDGADIDALTSLTNAFTIGFWLNPANPGVVTNPTSGATESLLMPLMAKASFTYNSGSKTTTSSSKMFMIWEETNSDNTNVLKVQVKGATTATFASSPYSANQWHYFWIVYSGSSSYIKIYIDLALSSGTLSGTIPTTLSSSTSHFSINEGVEGSQYNTAKNTGIIDDLVVFNVADISEIDISRGIYYGALYIADTTLSLYKEVNHSILFDNPSTIQINAVYGNRGNVYVGRSDGKLLKGSRTIWESRRDFANDSEINFLSTITRSTTDNLNIGNGALNITNAIVRV